MKKFIPFVILSAVLMFGATSCKKYEDGPAFSLASKKARVEGDWTFEEAIYVEEDGTTEDETEFLQAYFTKVSLTKDGDVTIELAGGSDTYNGTWKFDDKKENIIVTLVDGGSTEVWTWEITRLKSKELWFKWTFEGDSEYYNVKLKQ